MGDERVIAREVVRVTVAQPLGRLFSLSVLVHGRVGQHDAERIGADQVPGFRNGDVHGPGEVGMETHCRKFSGAKKEAAETED